MPEQSGPSPSILTVNVHLPAGEKVLASHPLPSEQLNHVNPAVIRENIEGIQKSKSRWAELGKELAIILGKGLIVIGGGGTRIFSVVGLTGIGVGAAVGLILAPVVSLLSLRKIPAHKTISAGSFLIGGLTLLATFPRGLTIGIFILGEHLLAFGENRSVKNQILHEDLKNINFDFNILNKAWNFLKPTPQHRTI